MYFLYSSLRSHNKNSKVNQEGGAVDNPVVCEAEDSFMCSVALDASTTFVTMVTVSISDAIASPVLLRIPARPGKEGIHVRLYLFTVIIYLFCILNGGPVTGMDFIMDFPVII